MQNQAEHRAETHNLLLGYIIWLFGFTGAHRFYYGRPVTGTIWFCTLGLCGIGWIVDAFLLPGMERSAERRYVPGPVNYSLAWVLLTYLGVFGIHRFYLGKIWTGLLYLLTGGFFAVGICYDFWTLNGQISEVNQANR